MLFVGYMYCFPSWEGPNEPYLHDIYSYTAYVDDLAEVVTVLWRAEDTEETNEEQNYISDEENGTKISR